MKLNNEYRFGITPTVNCPRSKFLMHQNIRTTFNAGKLIPFYIDTDIMPGDTFKFKGSMVIRMSTPIYPTMDNLFCDVRFFFIPHRIVWNNFKLFLGEAIDSAWVPSTEVTVPQVRVHDTGISGSRAVAKGDILQYMGIPIGFGTPNATNDGYNDLNALGYRAYFSVWNEYYRDENFCPPIRLATDDTTDYPSDNGTYDYGRYSNSAHRLPAKVAPVYKFKDYYNACLPDVQRGGAVSLPIGSTAPIFGNGDEVKIVSGGIKANWEVNHLAPDGVSYNYMTKYGTGDSTNNGNVTFSTDATETGLSADLSNAVAATINAQRLAFATQRILELSARVGMRMPEIIKGFFHVDGPLMAVLQRPEYLFGKRLPINMNQTVQTSSTDSTSPQGNTAAYSLTVDSDYYGTKSFTEWGTILGVLCVRNEESYSQGVARMWSRKRKLDFYWPQLAFLGEQTIKMKEIYATNTASDEDAWGFNERWIEYRTKPNLNTGAFSPQYAQTLASWHYGSNFTSAPVLSDTFRRATEAWLDRTLAVTSAVEDQFLMDSRWEMEATRPLPMVSVPGYVDHF